MTPGDYFTSTVDAAAAVAAHTGARASDADDDRPTPADLELDARYPDGPAALTQPPPPRAPAG